MASSSCMESFSGGSSCKHYRKLEWKNSLVHAEEIPAGEGFLLKIYFSMCALWQLNKASITEPYAYSKVWWQNVENTFYIYLTVILIQLCQALDKSAKIFLKPCWIFHEVLQNFYQPFKNICRRVPHAGSIQKMNDCFIAYHCSWLISSYCDWHRARKSCREIAL